MGVNMEEIWKDVEGFEGLYMISNHGRVWSHNSNRLMSTSLNDSGYEKITLSKNNKRKYITVHRLVAINFLPTVPNKYLVNHKDENKINNCVSNLEWCNNKENVNHGTSIVRMLSNRSKSSKWIEKNKKQSIPVTSVNISTGETKQYPSYVSAKKDGFDPSTISKCILGKKKTHHNHKWYRQSDFEQKEHKQCI